MFNSRNSLRHRYKATVQGIFQFKDAVDTLGQGVVMAVTCLAHTGKNFVFRQFIPVGVTGVLDAVVAMVYQSLKREAGLGDTHFQGAQRALDSQGGGDIEARDEAGEGVRDQRQIAKAFFGLEVGNITNPDLLYPQQSQGLDEIGSAPETGPGRAPLLIVPGQEQVILRQEFKKAVSPRHKAFLEQFRTQFVQYLARSHPRMALPELPHPRQNVFILSLALLLAWPRLRILLQSFVSGLHH